MDVDCARHADNLKLIAVAAHHFDDRPAPLLRQLNLDELELRLDGVTIATAAFTMAVLYLSHPSSKTGRVQLQQTGRLLYTLGSSYFCCLDPQLLWYPPTLATMSGPPSCQPLPQ
jgi:hypothetical protein